MKFVTQAEAEAYDRWYETPLGQWVDRCEREAVDSLLPPLAGLTVLDAGCGTGNFTLALAPLPPTPSHQGRGTFRIRLI